MHEPYAGNIGKLQKSAAERKRMIVKKILKEIKSEEKWLSSKLTTTEMKSLKDN